ncbi:MAG: hypothetical protein ACRCX4_02910 [Bacteroidales bacterium]
MEIIDITHNYAVWIACIAAKVRAKDSGFTVEQGKIIFDSLNFKRFVANPDILPNNSLAFDELHTELREQIIDKAKELFNKEFSHGVAAKLINIYFKTIYVCGGYCKHQNVRYIHPPIDSLLLNAIENKDEFRANSLCIKAIKGKKWTKLQSNEYQKIITELRNVMNDSPLWLVEKYWQVHR